MKKIKYFWILLSVFLMAAFSVSTFASRSSQSYLDLPVEEICAGLHFYSPSTHSPKPFIFRKDVPKIKQLCKEHCVEGANCSSAVEFAFLRFVIDPPRRSILRFYWDINDEGKTFLEKMENLAIAAYKKSYNKADTLASLQKLFSQCASVSKDLFSKKSCAYLHEKLWGQNYQSSLLSLKDIFAAIRKEKKLIYRGYEHSNLDEHRMPLSLLHWAVIWEYLLGDYLFWAVRESKEDESPGLMVLKAGDTHWQHFATIQNPDNIEWIEAGALTVKNNRLGSLVIRKHDRVDDTDYSQAYEFQLKDNGDWNLKNCWELVGVVSLRWYEDILGTDLSDKKNSYRVKKLPKSSCKGNINVKTEISLN